MLDVVLVPDHAPNNTYEEVGLLFKSIQKAPSCRGMYRSTYTARNMVMVFSYFEGNPCSEAQAKEQGEIRAGVPYRKATKHIFPHGGVVGCKQGTFQKPFLFGNSHIWHPLHYPPSLNPKPKPEKAKTVRL